MDKTKALFLLLFFLIAIPACGQSPVQAPTGVKSATETVQQAIINQTAGNTNLVAVSFCEQSCASNPSADTVAVSDAAGDVCVLLVMGTQANQVGQIWRCPITMPANTITATVAHFKTYVHVAMSLSEWTALPNVFAMAVGASSTTLPGSGFTLANPYNGSSVTAYGSGTPSFTPAPAGGIVSYSGPLQLPFTGSNGGSGFVATFPIVSLSQIPACGPSDGACSLTLQITDGNGNVVASGSAGSVAILKTFSGGTLTVPIVTIAPR